MILLLGASGFVGTAFHDHFKQMDIEAQPVSRKDVNYYDKSQLANLIRSTKPRFLVNCAGYTGKPNVDACEDNRHQTLLGNAVLPGLIREVCEDLRLPWGHVSSGCIYTGRRPDGEGFREQDPPNFSFRTNNCSFYSGTKALGEEVLEGAKNCYIWRLRIPFNEIDSPRNYVSKLLNYKLLLEAENSISHLGDFVEACTASYLNEIPFGTYNITNPGTVTTSQVTRLLNETIAPNRSFRFFQNEAEFMRTAARTPRSNCVLDTHKILRAGISIRPVVDALKHALKQWRWQTDHA